MHPQLRQALIDLAAGLAYSTESDAPMFAPARGGHVTSRLTPGGVSGSMTPWSAPASSWAGQAMASPVGRGISVLAPAAEGRGGQPHHETLAGSSPALALSDQRGEGYGVQSAVLKSLFVCRLVRCVVLRKTKAVTRSQGRKKTGTPTRGRAKRWEDGVIQELRYRLNRHPQQQISE
jgi:hypothetical protein